MKVIKEKMNAGWYRITVQVDGCEYQFTVERDWDDRKRWMVSGLNDLAHAALDSMCVSSRERTMRLCEQGIVEGVEEMQRDQ